MKKSTGAERIIGVIGGMGPSAGIDLLQKIVEETRASTDQEHLPVVMISYPGRINDRTRYLLYADGPDPAPEIARIALQLADAGAVVAGIPCNSAHAPAIFGVVESALRQAGTSMELLNMVDETVTSLRATQAGVRRVGVLSTNSIYRLGIYRDALAAAGFAPVLPPPDVQDALVHGAVYDPECGIKAQSRPVNPRARERLMEAIALLRREGAEAVILGCTEIPLAIPEAEVLGMPAIDPTRILARALVAHADPGKLRAHEPA